MMKKLFLSMLAIGTLAFTSCEKDEIDALNADLIRVEAQSSAADAQIRAEVQGAIAQIGSAIEGAIAAQAAVDAAQNEFGSQLALDLQAARAEVLGLLAAAEANILLELENSKAEIFSVIDAYVTQIETTFATAVAQQALVDAGQNEAFEAAVVDIKAAIAAGDLAVAQAASSEIIIATSQASSELLAAIEAGDAATTAEMTEAVIGAYNLLFGGSATTLDEVVVGIGYAIESGAQLNEAQNTALGILEDAIEALTLVYSALQGEIDLFEAYVLGELSNIGATVEDIDLVGNTFSISLSDGSSLSFDFGSASSETVTGTLEGITITSYGYNANSGILFINFSDGTTVTTGDLRGTDGVDGVDGVDGATGATGATGAAGQDGTPGATVSVQGYLDTIADLNAQIAAITPEDGASQADLDAANAALDTANELVATLEASIDALNADAAVDDATIADLQSQLDIATTAISVLSDTVADLQAELDAVNGVDDTIDAPQQGDTLEVETNTAYSLDATATSDLDLSYEWVLQGSSNVRGTDAIFTHSGHGVEIFRTWIVTISNDTNSITRTFNVNVTNPVDATPFDTYGWVPVTNGFTYGAISTSDSAVDTSTPTDPSSLLPNGKEWVDISFADGSVSYQDIPDATPHDTWGWNVGVNGATYAVQSLSDSAVDTSTPTDPASLLPAGKQFTDSNFADGFVAWEDIPAQSDALTGNITVSAGTTLVLPGAPAVVDSFGNEYTVTNNVFDASEHGVDEGTVFTVTFTNGITFGAEVITWTSVSGDITLTL